MKKIAFVCAALMLACGAAVAKDAKRPAAMSDAEMDAVSAGDIQFLLGGYQIAYIATPGLNTKLTGQSLNVGATFDGTGVVLNNKHVAGGFELKLPPLPMLPKP